MFSSWDDCSVLVALIGLVGIIGGPLVGALINSKTALSTASMIARAERQNYLDRRIWDTRKESYSLILTKLQETSKYADYIDEGYSSGGELHPEDYHASDESSVHQEKKWSAWEECKSEFDKNHLVLSADFVTAFQELIDELSKISEYDMLPYAAPRQARYFRDAHSRLFRIAKDEFAPSRDKVRC